MAYDNPEKYKAWRKKNREHRNRWDREWRAKNAEQYREYHKRRSQLPKVLASRAEYKRRRRKTDVQFRVSETLRHRLYMAFKGKKVGSAIALLGVPLAEAVHRIELQFQPGMAWGNYGQWHIDHRCALANFDLTDAEQVKIACHIDNLQPLWAAENVRKGATQ